MKRQNGRNWVRRLVYTRAVTLQPHVAVNDTSQKRVRASRNDVGESSVGILGWSELSTSNGDALRLPRASPTHQHRATHRYNYRIYLIRCRVQQRHAFRNDMKGSRPFPISVCTTDSHNHRHHSRHHPAMHKFQSSRKHSNGSSILTSGALFYQSYH